MELELKSLTEKGAARAQAVEAFSGLSLPHFRGNVSEALSHFGSFGLLEEYTRHDITHIDAMLSMYDWLIPSATREIMTPADWLLLTLTTYLHDFGLLVTRDEFDNRDSTVYPNYRDRIEDSQDSAFRDYRAQLKGMSNEARERFLYQEFVRERHAHRIRSWLGDVPDRSLGFDPRVTERLKSLLDELDPDFREDVGLVCESHHLDDLGDTRKYEISKPYGRTRDEEANVQYAAMLLRTSDLLHITKDRVPPFSALVINPRNAKSQVEWAKQRAVKTVRAQATPPVDGVPSPGPSGVVEVHATFTEADGFFGLTSYLQYANDQLSQTHEWAAEANRQHGLPYGFPWRRIDASHVRAKGFETETFAFSLDQAKILDLLTGHTLYNDSSVVVRELAQNSLDAVRLQQDTGGEPDYEPAIDIFWHSADRVLEVQDNGVGMTQRVIEQNFLKVGASRYQSEEFKKEYPNFAPISRFGIGVLSAFMVADDVRVVTNTGPSGTGARQINLRDVHGQYLVRLLDQHSDEIPELLRFHGTAVRLHLRPSAELASSVLEILDYWVVVPGCAVRLFLDDAEPIPIGSAGIGEALERGLTQAKLLQPGPDGLEGSYGRPAKVEVVDCGGVTVAYALTWSRWSQEWEFLSIPRAGSFAERDTRPVILGTCIGGVRVTDSAAGFRQGGIALMANASGLSAPKTNVARSAIERTDEYEDMLRSIYASIGEHLQDEMAALESRASSLTRAAQEASFMATDVAYASILESRDLFREELRRVQAIVVEQDGRRRRVALAELAETTEVTTVESSTVRSLELLLTSIRSAGSASLGGVLEALGVTGTPIPPAVPLVCNLQQSGYFSDLFAREWEVAELTGGDSGRSLTAVWRQKVPGQVRWASPILSREMPRSLQMLEEQLRTRVRAKRVVKIAKDAEILVSNISEQMVSSFGVLLLLPGHPLLSLKPSSAGVPEGHVDWVASWLASMVLQSGATNLNSHPGSVDMDFIDTLTRMLDSAGAFAIASETSVRSALAKNEY